VPTAAEFSEDGEDPEEYTPVTVTCPTSPGFTLCVIADDYPSSILYQQTFADLVTAHQCALKIFSQQHQSLPFVVTGCEWKVQGYYPDVPAEIAAMKDIEVEINMDTNNYILIWDHLTKNVVETQTLSPI